MTFVTVLPGTELSFASNELILANTFIKKLDIEVCRVPSHNIDHAFQVGTEPVMRTYLTLPFGSFTLF